MRVVDVEEEDCFGVVETELHVLHFVVYKGSQYRVLKGHASQFCIIFLCEFGKADTWTHLAALVGVFYYDFDGVHVKMQDKLVYK